MLRAFLVHQMVSEPFGVRVGRGKIVILNSHFLLEGSYAYWHPFLICNVKSRCTFANRVSAKSLVSRTYTECLQLSKSQV